MALLRKHGKAYYERNASKTRVHGGALMKSVGDIQQMRFDRRNDQNSHVFSSIIIMSLPRFSFQRMEKYNLRLLTA